MKSSCLSVITACRKLLGISLGSRVLHVQPMDLQCTWGWAGAGKEHSDCVAKLPFCCPLPLPVVITALPASIRASSICFPLNIIPQICVRFLQTTENVIYLWDFVYESNTWGGICLTECGPLKSQHFWNQVPKAVKGTLGWLLWWNIIIICLGNRKSTPANWSLGTRSRKHQFQSLMRLRI